MSCSNDPYHQPTNREEERKTTTTQNSKSQHRDTASHLPSLQGTTAAQRAVVLENELLWREHKARQELRASSTSSLALHRDRLRDAGRLLREPSAEAFLLEHNSASSDRQRNHHPLDAQRVDRINEAKLEILRLQQETKELEMRIQLARQQRSPVLLPGSDVPPNPREDFLDRNNTNRRYYEDSINRSAIDRMSASLLLSATSQPYSAAGYTHGGPQGQRHQEQQSQPPPRITSNDTAAAAHPPLPARTTFRIVAVSKDEDMYHLSDYQRVIRECMEFFEVDKAEEGYCPRQRNVLSHQVGIRCCFCSHRPVQERGKGALYFPRELAGIYQAAQNLVRNHLLAECKHIPDGQRKKIVQEQSKSKRKSGGRQYWVDSSAALGLYDRDGRVFFRD